MGSFVRRRVGAAMALAGLALMLALPATVTGTITGGCTATGHAASTGDIDLTNETDWHVASSDTLSGDGNAPALMTSGSLSAYALGIAIPIVPEKTGKGDTTGSVDGISMETFSKLGKVFVIAGKASGDGQCDGQILIVVDDVDAIFTVLGGGGLAAFIIGLAAVLMAARSSGCVPRALGLFFGAVAGAGLGLTLEQFQVISPTSPVGLAILIVGALLGFLLGGGFPFLSNPDPEASPAPAAPRPGAAPPVSDETQSFINDVAAPGVGGTTPPPTPPAAPAPPSPAAAQWPIPKNVETVMDAVDTGGEILGLTPPEPDDYAPPPASLEGSTPGVNVGQPSPGEPGAGDGGSHTIPSDPNNPPVGGGGPM